MWFAISHLDSHNRLQIFVMFCQVPDPIPCSHAEMHIMVIYVLGEFISPILLRSFVSTGGWYIHYWFSFKMLHWHCCAPGGMGAGRQTELKGTQLRNGSELRSLSFPSFLYPYPLFTSVANSKHCVFVLFEWGSRSAQFRKELSLPLCWAHLSPQTLQSLEWWRFCKGNPVNKLTQWPQEFLRKSVKAKELRIQTGKTSLQLGTHPVGWILHRSASLKAGVPERKEHLSFPEKTNSGG